MYNYTNGGGEPAYRVGEQFGPRPIMGGYMPELAPEISDAGVETVETIVAPAESPVPLWEGDERYHWQPDFNKVNPWVGMPADYAGVATFVRTAENPLPPWEAAVGAEAIPMFNSPEYNALAQRIINEARLTLYTGSPKEKGRATVIISSGQKATLARAGFPYAAEEEEPARAALGWGLLAVIALVAFANRRK